MPLTKNNQSTGLTIVVTGTPGTGKTFWAKELGKALRTKVVSDKQLAHAHPSTFTVDTKAHEDVVDITKLAGFIQKEWKGRKTPLIAEGHLLCEMKLPADAIIVLTCQLNELEKRLEKRKYSELKIQDNLFCEEENYCLKQAKTNYSHVPMLVIQTHKPKKVIRERMLDWIQSIRRGKFREISYRTRTRPTSKRPRTRAHA